MSTLRRVLVTGSTRNIGLAIAKRLATEGWCPVLNYAHDEGRAAVALAAIREIQPEAELVRADVTRPDAVDRMAVAVAAGGPIDLLVNNVGWFLYKPFLDTSPTEWDAALARNLSSVAWCCRAVLPAMRAQRRGGIVNIVSMHAERPRAVPRTLPYTIAKAGVVLLTKTLAKTEGPYGIRVNAVSPGYVDTGANVPPDAASKVPLRRIARPAEIAAAVSFLVSEDAGYVTGSVLDVHGGALL